MARPTAYRWSIPETVVTPKGGFGLYLAFSMFNQLLKLYQLFFIAILNGHSYHRRNSALRCFQLMEVSSLEKKWFNKS